MGAESAPFGPKTDEDEFIPSVVYGSAAPIGKVSQVRYPVILSTPFHDASLVVLKQFLKLGKVVLPPDQFQEIGSLLATKVVDPLAFA